MNNALDVRIMKLLSSNGRMPNAVIARRLEISEATVRQRLKRLIEKYGLKFSAEIDTETIPHTFIIIVGITLNILPEECIDKVTSLPNVLFTFTVTGRYDIIAVFAVNSRQKLSEVVETQLHSIPGVGHTETFVAMKNEGMSINVGNFCNLMD